jgi:hypothetical protein
MDRVKTFMGDNWLFLLFLIVIGSAFVFLRSSPTALADEGEFDAILTNGKPGIVEFFSNT